MSSERQQFTVFARILEQREHSRVVDRFSVGEIAGRPAVIRHGSCIGFQFKEGVFGFGVAEVIVAVIT